MLNKEEHFNKIVAENSGRIERICAYYCGNTEDQKDMCQEVLVNIWKSLDQFRGEAALSTWIYRIAVNTSLTFRGKAMKELKWKVDAEQVNIGNLLDDSGLGEKMKQEQQFNKLELALNTLSIIDKSLITLMLEGLSMKEIADVIGLTEPNVRVKIHRIKTDLKNRLKDKNDE